MKMYLNAKVFPSWFARQLTEGVNFKPYSDANKCEYALRQFQAMSVNSDFDTCMINYANSEKEISIAEKDILRKVHEMTKDFVLGHITDELSNKLAATSTSGRDAAQIGSVLRDITLGEITEDENGDNKKKQNNIGMRVILTTDDKK